MLVHVCMYEHVLDLDMLNNMYMYCTRSPLTFKSGYVLLGTMEVEHELMVTVVTIGVDDVCELLGAMEVEHELMVTVVVATMYGDVVTSGADEVCELLGIAKVKSVSHLNYLIG